MGEIKLFHPQYWKNFSREDSNIPQEILEFILQTPIYTKEEFDIKKRFNRVPDLNSYNTRRKVFGIVYSPKADLTQLEYAKFNYLHLLHQQREKVDFVTHFAYKKSYGRYILLEGRLHY